VDPDYIDYVILSPRLHEILGITYAGKGYYKNATDVYPFIVKALRPPELSSHIETLYTYCNIIQKSDCWKYTSPITQNSGCTR